MPDLIKESMLQRLFLKTRKDQTKALKNLLAPSNDISHRFTRDELRQNSIDRDNEEGHQKHDVNHKRVID